MLRRAIEAHPKEAMPRYVLAGALDALGRADESRASLREFLERADPSDPRLSEPIAEARRALAEP